MTTEQNKSEKPTPYKLKKAREQGQVSKSIEVNAIVMMAAMLAMCFFAIETWLSAFKAKSKQVILVSGNVSNEPYVLIRFLSETIISYFGEFTQLFIVLIIAAVLTNVLQVGVLFTVSSLKPNFSKLSPKTNLKRIISKKTLFEFLKTLIKIFVLFMVCYAFKSKVITALMPLIGTNSAVISNVWVDLTLQIFVWILCLLIMIAALDFMFSRWQHLQKMMMSKQEVKDEHKKREGDPEIKAKRKQTQKELLEKTASLSNVKDADVIVTNPTHIAVALKYDINTMPAPKVLAMGKGQLANLIRQQGRRYKKPIIQNRPVARKLYKEGSLDQFIPLACFEDVASIFRIVFGFKEQHADV